MKNGDYVLVLAPKDFVGKNIVADIVTSII